MRYNIIFCRTLENHSIQKAPHNLINSLGDGTLTDDKVKSAERFICKLYKVPDSVDVADEKVCTFREGNQSWSLTTNAVIILQSGPYESWDSHVLKLWVPNDDQWVPYNTHHFKRRTRPTNEHKLEIKWYDQQFDQLKWIVQVLKIIS